MNNQYYSSHSGFYHFRRQGAFLPAPEVHLSICLCLRNRSSRKLNSGLSGSHLLSGCEFPIAIGNSALKLPQTKANASAGSIPGPAAAFLQPSSKGLRIEPGLWRPDTGVVYTFTGQDAWNLKGKWLLRSAFLREAWEKRRVTRNACL